MAVPVERKFNEAANQRKREDECNLIAESAQCDTERLQSEIECLETTEQRPAKKHHDRQDDMYYAEALTCDRIVRCLLMGLERDRAAERARNRRTIQLNMPDLPLR